MGSSQGHSEAGAFFSAAQTGQQDAQERSMPPESA